ncbi:hypothetical protein G6F38_014137 [Rhizopus arrhizus]|nr:hypothetical protein G6F38_014137 [Rhizopus arrhizus]
MAVVQFPVHTKYALGLRLGRSLRLICLYLPPSLSNDEVSSVLVSLPWMVVALLPSDFKIFNFLIRKSPFLGI